MLAYTDPRWNTLIGGYRIIYNPAPLLQKLASGQAAEQLWDTLWEELYHQQDIGSASYAAVVCLADILQQQPAYAPQIYSFTLAVELAHLEPELNNPPPPDWLEAEYQTALTRIYEHARDAIGTITDEYHLYSALGIIALYKKQFQLANLLIASSEADIADYFETR